MVSRNAQRPAAPQRTSNPSGIAQLRQAHVGPLGEDMQVDPSPALKSAVQPALTAVASRTMASGSDGPSFAIPIKTKKSQDPQYAMPPASAPIRPDPTRCGEFGNPPRRVRKTSVDERSVRRAQTYRAPTDISIEPKAASRFLATSPAEHDSSARRSRGNDPR